MKSIFKMPINQKIILYDDSIFNEINFVQKYNSNLLFELNNSKKSESEKHDIICKITVSSIDKSNNIWLPFYTDFGRHINLGKNNFINIGVTMVDLGGIQIDDNVLIGLFAKIISTGHPINPNNRNGVQLSSVHLENNSWIGAGSTILDGVTVGENSVVGADSVVTKNVPKNSVVVGNPAKVIKKI